MSDAQIRNLERAARTGDAQARRALVAEWLRTGQLAEAMRPLATHRQTACTTAAFHGEQTIYTGAALEKTLKRFQLQQASKGWRIKRDGSLLSEGQYAGIDELRLSPDRGWLLCRSEIAHSLRLISLEGDAKHLIGHGQNRGPKGLDFDAAGRAITWEFLFAAEPRSVLTVWDHSGQKPAPAARSEGHWDRERHSRGILRASAEPGVFYLGLRTGEIECWQASDLSAPASTTSVGAGAVSALAPTPDGAWLLAVCQAKEEASPARLVACRVERGALRGEPVLLDEAVHMQAVEISPCGSFAISAAPPRWASSAQPRATLWSLMSLPQIQRVSEFPGCAPVAFAPGGSRALVGGGEGEADQFTVWSLLPSMD